MNFSLKTAISDCTSLDAFFEQWNVGDGDLIISNEFLLMPALDGKPAPCSTIFQENFGFGEPSDEMVDSMLAAVKGKEFSRIIAIGGGSVIDVAKLFVFGDGLSCEEIFADGASLARKRKLVIVPTTCGTGSEVTCISIVEFIKKQTKLGLAVPAMFADEAVLIPALLDTLPYEVFATSSIDALIHAAESYVSPKANAFTKALGRSAIEQILSGYMELTSANERGVLPSDMSAFLFASTMAGIAFGNAGVGTVHAMAYLIGGNYHVPHGKSNYLVFSEVFAKYKSLGADISELEAVLASCLKCPIESVWEELPILLDKILTRQPLASLGATEAKCAKMAGSVIQNQQRLLVNNPIKLSEEDILSIYLRCL